MKDESIARVAHEVNRAYCEALGDTSQVPWADAPEWQRKSAINGAAFHRANPDAGPEHSHNAWLKEKSDNGWSWGSEKNEERKEHPCFVPYNELPVEQKAKDYIFRSIVHSLLKAGCLIEECYTCDKWNGSVPCTVEVRGEVPA